MKYLQKIVALIFAVLMLSGAYGALAATYVSEQITPDVAGSSSDASVPDEATPEVSLEPEPLETKTVVTTDSESSSVNIRAAAGMSAEIIGKLSSDTSVTVLSVVGDWSLIRADGVVGYVFSEYLKGAASEGEALTQVESDIPPEEQTEVDADLSGLTVEIFSTLDNRVKPGETIRLTSRLTGFEGIAYALQWQYNDGSGWKDVTGAIGSTYEFEATLETVQYMWRLAVTV